MVTAQRDARAEARLTGEKFDKSTANNLAIAAASEGNVDKKGSNSSQIDLTKKLKYAKWPITEFQFRAIQVFLAVFLAIPAYNFATIFIVFLGLFMGMVIPTSILDRAIKKRFMACLLYTSPSPRDATLSRMPSSA